LPGAVRDPTDHLRPGCRISRTGVGRGTPAAVQLPRAGTRRRVDRDREGGQPPLLRPRRGRRAGRDRAHEKGLRPVNLEMWNALPAAEAERELLAVCRAPRWAREVAAARPHGSVDAVQATAGSALTDADLDEAMAGHPRIGDRAVTGSSRREQ